MAKTIDTCVEGFGDKKYHFEYEANDHPINIGDYYIYGFGGIVDVLKCETENEMYEINPNDRKSTGIGDLVTGFWQSCHKIISTDLDLTLVD